MTAEAQRDVVYPSKFHGSRRSFKDQSIILAAQKIFLAKGFDSASMDDIALEANVSKRTIYNRYASKLDLFSTVAIKACEKVISFDFHLPMNLPIKKNLTNMAHQILHGYLAPEAVALRRLVTFQSAKSQEIGQAYTEHALKPIFTCLTEYFKNLKENGKFKGILSPKECSWLFVPMIVEPLNSKIMMGGYRPENLTDEIDKQVSKNISQFMTLTQV